MATLTPAQVYALAERHFGDLGPQVVAEMAAVALGESGGNTQAHNNRGEDSRGPWQINVGPGANTDLAGMDLFDPDQNARAARIVYDRQGPRAWSVYQQGIHQRFLPQVQEVAGQQSGEAISMTSQNATEMLAGYMIPMLEAQIANMGEGNMQTWATLAGYLNPATFGGSGTGMLPTLARDMFEQERRNADRQYVLDVARFGADSAMANYQQRLGAAQVKLSEAGLKASLRGPDNAIAYNYALNNLNPPEGTQAGPSIADGLVQPIPTNVPQAPPQTVQQPATGAPQGTPQATGQGAPGAIAMPAIQPGADGHFSDAGLMTAGQRAISGGADPDAIARQLADLMAIRGRQQAATTASQGQGQVQGQPQPQGSPAATSPAAAPAPSPAPRRTGPPPAGVGSIDSFGAPPIAAGRTGPRPAGVGAIDLLAGGGVTSGMAVVGERGPEVAVSMPAGGFAVLNQEQLGMDPMDLPAQRAEGGGIVPDATLDRLGTIIRQSVGSAPRAEEGGLFFDDGSQVLAWLDGLSRPDQNRERAQAYLTTQAINELRQTFLALSPEQRSRLALSFNEGDWPYYEPNSRSQGGPGTGGTIRMPTMFGPKAWQHEIGHFLDLSNDGEQVDWSVPLMDREERATGFQSALGREMEGHGRDRIEAARMLDGGLAEREPMLGVTAAEQMAQGGGIEQKLSQYLKLGQPTVPRAAEGGLFGSGAANTIYSPQEIAGMPALQKIAGNAPSRAFGQTALDTTVPGTDFTLPQGHQANVRTLQSLAPSEMQTLGSVVETPRDQGGLGLIFGDWLHAAQAAAPTGRSFGPAGYSR